jgi:hypothetical protein
MKNEIQLALLLITGALFLGSPLHAGTLDLTSEKNVVRDGGDLQVDVREAVDRDTDVADTALVFTNTGDRAARVVCGGLDKNGQVIGSRTGVIIPAGGLRYLRASDLSDGADFVGSAICSAGGPMLASGIFLAPGAMTDVNVHQREHRKHSRIRFPLVATY